MKKIQFVSLLALFLVSTVIYSCKKDDDTPPANTDSPYKGSWEGTFSGDDNGTWTAVIGASGAITGELVSGNLPGTPFPIAGTINGTGAFDAHAVVMGDTVVFIGQASNSTTAAGNWQNLDQSMSGTWAGSKD
jgi:hypothetical protein